MYGYDYFASQNNLTAKLSGDNTVLVLTILHFDTNNNKKLINLFNYSEKQSIYYY